MSDTESSPEEYMEPGEVPDPPRPITAKARARATREPKVRFCWIVAALIALSWIYATVTGLTSWWSEARVINRGEVVQAIGFAEGAKITGRPLPHGAMIDLEYTYKGVTYTPRGPLLRTGEQYIAGEPFEIRIDPSNPNRWSNRQDPVSLKENMVASLLLGIFTVVAVVFGLILRQMHLSVWRHGELSVARVLEHRQSALAPKSVALYCAVRSGKEDRPLTVFVPQDGHVPAVGETIPLVVNSSRTTAVALAGYHP